jgi:hypothetical protein
MQSDGTGGRVGGTQFDEKVINGRRSEQVSLLVTPQYHCPYCDRNFIPRVWADHKLDCWPNDMDAD